MYYFIMMQSTTIAPNWDTLLGEYTDLKTAIKYAEYFWDHLTPREKRDRYIEVVHCPDEPDVPYGDIENFNSDVDYHIDVDGAYVEQPQTVPVEKPTQESSMPQTTTSSNMVPKKRDHHSYERVFIGDSDVASLICESKNGVLSLRFGADGHYMAYIVDAECVIPDYYTFVWEGRNWLCIYDDEGLTRRIDHSGSIRIYRAGEFGCIIQKV